jgi:hypothetical protein
MPQPNGDVDVYYARVDAARDWITHTMKGWQ